MSELLLLGTWADLALSCEGRAVRLRAFLSERHELVSSGVHALIAQHR